VRVRVSVSVGWGFGGGGGGWRRDVVEYVGGREERCYCKQRGDECGEGGRAEEGAQVEEGWDKGEREEQVGVEGCGARVGGLDGLD
jgi:hypothetical protein